MLLLNSQVLEHLGIVPPPVPTRLQARKDKLSTREFWPTLKFAARTLYEDSKCQLTQPLDIFRHTVPKTPRRVGRSVFKPPPEDNPQRLDSLHTAWFGYYASVWPAVKATAELRAGVLTECAQESMVSDDIEDKIIRGMLTKICFKIYAKIGGCSRLGCTEGENVFRIAIVIGIGPRREVRYDRGTQVLPSEAREDNRLRDGVSDGEFEVVLAEELEAIKSSYRVLECDTSEHNVTSIVVQRRHQTRSECMGAVWARKNVPPCTIVDTVVAHPDHVNFLSLQPRPFKGKKHAGSGTSRHRPGTGASASARPDKPTFTIPGPISLLTNYFKITLSEEPIYHYDVDIRLRKEAKASSDSNKRTLSRRVNRMVIEQLARDKFTDCAHAFDGKKNLYTSVKLPKHELTFTEYLDDKSDDGGFIVALKFTSAITHKQTEKLIQALDIIIRHAASVSHTPVVRSFFKPPKADPNGYQMLYTLLSGFYTSVRCCQNQPMLNIDLSAAFFYNPMPLLDFTRMAINVDVQEAEKVVSAHNRLSLELKGLLVSTLHRGYKRCYRVIKVTDCSAKEVNLNDWNELPPETERSAIEEFNVRKKTNVKVTEHGLPNEGPKTVAELFETKYPDYMKDSNLPCVQCEGKKNKPDLPLDICSIEAQPYNRKLDDGMREAMIKFAGRNPQQRFDCIKKWARELLSMGQKRLEGFDMTFLVDPVNVEGHILSPPSIQFRQSTSSVENGCWYIGLDDRFFTREHDIACGVLVIGNKKDIVEEAARLLEKCGRHHGLPLRVQSAESLYSKAPRAQLTSRLEKLKLSLEGAKRIVLVALEDESYYATVKSVADVQVGILTQCVKLKSMKGVKEALKDDPKDDPKRRRNKTIPTNICLKINAKLGGCNNKLGDSVFKKSLEDTLLIGIDVNHPAPGDNETPSFAGCVASMDADAVQYSARVAVQIDNEAAVGRKEVVTNLQDMVQQLLKSYESYNGGVRPLPKRIIVYRDGVSEGQFPIVLQHELCAIRSACKTVGNYAPKVTFIVVQKRHHTRFQIAKAQWVTYNVPPGTTVDTLVTHPDHVNFFLCSHAGLLGTSRPAHYHVLHDDTKLSKERVQQLQQLSYFLCHLVARCTRSRHDCGASALEPGRAVVLYVWGPVNRARQYTFNGRHGCKVNWK
ncbi:hypothetical protein HPB50_014672 [Hyalomma asiaticum]|uniref:Uncharacterized protein n=1 Tax=Hyalomma asiaticum TaxID=266040 RepID=A0ACB7S7Q0_HYAAI|nr:hypothetical protein HPB50_014672 [Hyalomma asiaticum]